MVSSFCICDFWCAMVRRGARVGWGVDGLMRPWGSGRCGYSESAISAMLTPCWLTGYYTLETTFCLGNVIFILVFLGSWFWARSLALLVASEGKSFSLGMTVY